MITIRVTGQPIFSITGDTYSASVPVAAYEDGWPGEQTALLVTGLISEPNTLATFKTRLQAASQAWQVSLVVKKALANKLVGLEGKTL